MMVWDRWANCGGDLGLMLENNAEHRSFQMYQERVEQMIGQADGWMFRGKDIEGVY